VPRVASGRKTVPDEDSAQQRHRERLYRPIDESVTPRHRLSADALAPSEPKSILSSIGHNHEPDENGADWTVDLRHLRRSDRPKKAWHNVAKRDAGDDTERNPQREITFEDTHEIRPRRGDRR